MKGHIGLLASPWMPRRLAAGIVRAFAAWQARHWARADRKLQPLPGAESLAGPVYLLDGYHGGIPFWDWLLLSGGGLWGLLHWPAVGEVLVRRAREGGLPVTLELDGYTYAAMAERQPEALARLKERVAAGAIEIVNGTYAQPFLRTVSGETMVRQFAHGLAAIEGALGVEVESYASQEPCFCAQLPQILAGFGYKYTLLRTHWAPFGEEAAHDAPLVRWQGPDGSVVMAVPRHTWMDYQARRGLHPGALRGNLTGAHASHWTAGGLQAFRAQAAAHGSDPPLLSKLEDLSPTESPTAAAAALTVTPHVHLTSLAAYCRLVLAGHGPEDLPTWRLTPDDLPLSLPWGLEGDVLMQARDQAEAALLVAERADAVAHWLGLPSREKDLYTAWGDLLLGQHHDLHVCGPWLSRAHGGAQGAPMSAVGCGLCAGAEEVARRVTEAALSALLERVHTAGFGGRPLLVFNPEARWQRALVRVPLDLTGGRLRPPVRSVVIHDGTRALPAQADGERVAFVCDLPPLGWRVFDLRRGGPGREEQPGTAFEFRNEFYKARLARDGGLTLSAGGRTLLDGGATLRLWREGRWWDKGAVEDEGLGAGATCEALAGGPVYVRWRVRGNLGGIGFAQDLTLYPALPRLEIATTLDFDGAPFGPQPEDGDGYYARDEHKLCACLPLAPGGRIVHETPFFINETCRPRFVGGRWVAVEGDSLGLAVLAPGARGYAYDEESGLLRRVLAWSPGAWIYASDDSVTPGGSRYTLLRGRRTFRYALLPYRRRYEVVAEAGRYCLPPAIVAGGPSPGDLGRRGGLLQVEGEAVEVSALFVRGGATYARLWNASGVEEGAAVHVPGGGELAAVGLRLEGGERLAGGQVRLRPWGIQTVRLDR